MKNKIIVVSILLLLVAVFVCGCSQFMENIGLVKPPNEEQLSPEKGGPPDGLAKVLIGFKDKPGPAEQELVKGVGGKIKYAYNLVPAVAASIPEAAIEALKKNPNITNIDLDIKVYVLDGELDNSWGVKRIGAGLIHDIGNTGTGVKVAVIDSGIDYDHPDLAGNYKGGYDFVNNDNDPMDDEGHGTHVAGIIAALDDSIGVVGVAPDANIYALKVLGSDGSGDYSDVIAALQWCVENGIQVTNNSYGSSQDPGTIVKDAFDNAFYNFGIIHVAAAGNSGTPPGKGDNIIYPARYDSVIAVAATDQNDQRATWSSTGSDLELSAPGVAINSTLLGGGYGEKSGTSMASPHVTGTVALMIADGITEIRTILQNTVDDIGPAGWDSSYGYGLVNAAKAVEISPPPSETKMMHVESIEMNLVTKNRGGNAFVNAIALVTIVDGVNNSVEGATVSGHWSGVTTSIVSGITNASGKVSLKSGQVKNPVSGTTFTFTVDDISKTGWTYDSIKNVESSDSIAIP